MGMPDHLNVPRPSLNEGSSLKGLAAEFGWSLRRDSDVIVTGVSGTSTGVRAGDLFVAIPGARHHGASFAADAVARGAVAIATDEAGARQLAPLDVPIAVSLDPRGDLGLVASSVFGTRALDTRLYAVTGTNGKTSVVYMLDALARSLGRQTGLSSTAERIIDGDVVVSGLTTPEADEIHALIAVMAERGVTDVTVEVSAHALTRSRVTGLHFDVAAFTNFSQDHLDDYADLEDYFAAKESLFAPEWTDAAVVCVDDAWGRRLANSARVPVVTVASHTAGDAVEADWQVEVTASEPTVTRFRMSGPDGARLDAGVDMVGDFSAVNMAIAVLMMHRAGVSLKAIAGALPADGVLRARVPGRMQVISGDEGPLLFVDYGHTPQAFARTLAALRRLTTGRLFMVFGADGDRDPTKREDMGRVAATGADVVIITDYHPRSEDPAQIRAALMSGALVAASNAELHDVADPRQAIRFAVRMAEPSDTILYAGPGDETYQEVAGDRIPFDARDEARQALREAGWSPREAGP